MSVPELATAKTVLRPIVLSVHSPSWQAATRQQLPPQTTPRWVADVSQVRSAWEWERRAPIVLEIDRTNWRAVTDWLVEAQIDRQSPVVIGVGALLGQPGYRQILAQAGLAAGLARPDQIDRLGGWLRRVLAHTRWPESTLEQQFRQNLPWPKFAGSE